jgi:hypothetical protein
MPNKKFTFFILALALSAVAWYSLWPPPYEAPVSKYTNKSSDFDMLEKREITTNADAIKGIPPAPTTGDRVKALVPLHFQDAQFKLLAASPELSDRYKAYGWLKECLNERSFATMNAQYQKLCGLSEGNIDNIELRKRLVVDLAMNAAFGGVENLIEEGPRGRFRAFADDPAGHATLVLQAYELGTAKGEPSALAAQSGELEAQGDRLQASGDAESARTQYVRSLAYSVASALGLAQQNGRWVYNSLRVGKNHRLYF